MARSPRGVSRGMGDRGLRGRSRSGALRDPCASRSSPGDGAFGTSPVPSSPEIDPPPRGALSAIRVVCGIAVCSPPPAFCPCVPAQRATCLPRWEPWSRATPASFSGAVLNPPTFGVPAPVALAQGARFPDCLFGSSLAQHRPPVFRLLLQGRLKVDELIFPHSSHHTQPV